MIKFILSSIFGLILFVSCNLNITQKEDKTWQWYKSFADSILNSPYKSKSMLFVESEKGNFQQISKLNDWDKQYIYLIKVINSSEVKIYIEIPFSESGDWNNEYRYIFNPNGRLKLLTRKSSFFNSGCTEGILNEVEDFAIESGQLKKMKHDILDQNNKVIGDTLNCIFNYRFNYPVYLNYHEIPIVKKFKDILDK